MKLNTCQSKIIRFCNTERHGDLRLGRWHVMMGYPLEYMYTCYQAWEKGG